MMQEYQKGCRMNKISAEEEQTTTVALMKLHEKAAEKTCRHPERFCFSRLCCFEFSRKSFGINDTLAEIRNNLFDKIDPVSGADGKHN